MNSYSPKRRGAITHFNDYLMSYILAVLGVMWFLIWIGK